MLKIAMLSTGEEVLHGDIVDTNAAWLSDAFYQQGFALTKRSTVGDQEKALIEEFLMLSFNFDIVIVNGGLGPTSDDMSAAAAAQANDEELVLSQGWLSVMEGMFAQRGKEMPKSNIKQAMLPSSATVVDNPVGTACGFKMQINDATFYFTPGVPREFKKMVTDEILPDLKRQYPSTPLLQCNRLYTFGLTESGIADSLSLLQLPKGYELGYRSYSPFIEVKLFGPTSDPQIRSQLMSMINNILKQHVVSIDKPMRDELGDLLERSQLTLSLAEKSTKGWLSWWLQSNAKIENACGNVWVINSNTDVTLDESIDVLAASFALAGATRDKCSTDLSLVTGTLTDKQFTLVLATPQGEWGQQLELTRLYTSNDAQTLIGTLAADMLRRYLTQQPMFVEYSAVKRLNEMYIPNSKL